MKITQSQLKSLVRTIVKESVSELTKGKRRRSLKENAGKKVASVSCHTYGRDVMIDGKTFDVHEMTFASNPATEDDDELFDKVSGEIEVNLYKKHGVTHVSSTEDGWNEKPVAEVEDVILNFHM
jgi:hypothetical protein